MIYPRYSQVIHRLFSMPFRMHISPTGRPSRSHPPADLGTGTAAARPTRSAARRANGRCRTEATAPGGGPRGGGQGATKKWREIEETNTVYNMKFVG